MEGIHISNPNYTENPTTSLGIELGSTRIKAVRVDRNRAVLESGSHHWESRFAEGHWTYSLEDVKTGLRDAVSALSGEADLTDGIGPITTIGISAMMHGYLVFDKDGNLLVPFRTWKDTTTKESADRLTALFDFNIPERWSVAHLYQAILNKEPHVKDIAFITTLAGYVHWRLTGRKVIGVGDASGMFPISGGTWNPDFVGKFRELTGINWLEIAPEILTAGQDAGSLTDEGMQYLFGDNTGIAAGHCTLCPPEGDAGTGMVSCKAIAPGTGNVSAGTSIFAMIVLEKPLSRFHREIDIVTTPDGRDVAMVHYNECTSKIDPRIELFAEAFEFFGRKIGTRELYDGLYEYALKKDSRLGAFMRETLESAVSDLASGIRVLTEEEHVRVDRLAGHGGFFKSGLAGRTIMSELTGIPIELSETAAEGGAWGIALLADYLNDAGHMTLGEYLEAK